MGIRLYPITPENLTPEQSVQCRETMAGVPAGTAQRLGELSAKHGQHSGRYFEVIMQDENLDRLHSFDLFGWGKFRSPEGLDWDAMTTSNKEMMTSVLELNGIHLTDAQWSLLNGLYWN